MTTMSDLLNESRGFDVFVRGLPAPQGSKRAFVVKGRPVMVEDNKHSRPWRQLVRECVALEFQKMMTKPFSGPVELVLIFLMPRPPSIPKSRQWPAVRPDLDKLVRAVLDALQGAAVIYQDAQVIKLVAEKRYAPPDTAPGMHLHIEATNA